jgi:uncharacterized protein (TIGR02996 family)
MARELARRYLSIVSSGTGGWVVSRLEAVAAELEKTPPPAALDAALVMSCEALEARLGIAYADRERATRQLEAGLSRDAELEAAVYRDPDSDDARLVFADALSERGDPRGEMIALQIAMARGTATDEQKKRVDALLSRHGGDWARPLSSAGACKVARGFPSSIDLYSRPAKEAIGAPGWATIERIRGLSGLTHKLAAEILNGPGHERVVDPGSLKAPVFKLLDDAERAWTKLTVVDAYDLKPGALRIAPRVAELELLSFKALPPALLGPLPALRKLTLETSGVLPPGMWDGASALDELTLKFGRGDAGGPLPASLRRLILSVEWGVLPAGFLDGVPGLRELVLGGRAMRERPDWSKLPALRSLVIRAGGAQIPPALFEGLGPIEYLDAIGAPVSSLPALPLRAARLGIESPAGASVVIDRFPDLVDVELHFPHDCPPAEVAAILRAAGFTEFDLAQYRLVRAKRPT